MKLGVTLSVAAATVLGIAGCTTTTTVVEGAPNPNKADGGIFGMGPTAEAGPGTPPPEEEEDPAKQPPHALGRVLLGEAHTSKGMSTPIVSASFFPDARFGKTCKTQIAGCEITAVPKCGTGSTTAACKTGEACTFDDACAPVCVKVCTKSCKADEVCYFASPNTPACRKIEKPESFDAGALAFSGTTTPLTLFPPYVFESKGGGGAPFLAGASLQVQASGATDVGFEKFDEKFTATQFIQTTPALDKMPKSTIFGAGAIPVGWTPGSDKIAVTVTGSGGSATCKASDASGKFDIPREVAKAVQGEGTGTSAFLSITVSRERKEVKKDKQTKGKLTSIEVQPVGWLELVTVSSESASFQGCATSTPDSCDDRCVNLQTSSEDCGTCGNACGSEETCNAGKCGGGTSGTCQSCETTAQTGVCKTQITACMNNTDCSAFASCRSACTDSACDQACATSHPSGAQVFDTYIACICEKACATQCADSCQ